MGNRLQDIFDKIHAEDELKKNTAAFLHEQINKRSRVRRVPQMRFAAVCASFVLLLFAGAFSWRLYVTPDAFVDVDVNPSVELVLNRFDRVMEAYPYNDEGAVILQSIDVRNKTGREAVQILLDEMIARDYLQPDGLVSVTVQTNDAGEEQKMLREIKASVKTLLSSHHSGAAMEVFTVTQEVKECAHNYNLSPAKYLAITELQEVDPTVSYETCKSHSISELQRLTENHGGHHHGQTAEDGGTQTENAESGDIQSGSGDDGAQEGGSAEDLEDVEELHPSSHHGCGRRGR